MDDMEGNRRWTLFIMLLSFILGFIGRLFPLFLSSNGINSDTAMPGLMGLHILRGDFPIFWEGQGYMAPIDSYLNAIVTYIFGVSIINSLIIPFLFSLIFPFITYLLTKKVFNNEAATLSFILTSIPPTYLLIQWGYMIPIIIGNILLILTISLFYYEESKEKIYRKYLLLGFLAGLGWWINWIILPYIATVFLFLLLKDKFFFIRRQFFIFCGFFLIGSIPFWIFNLANNFWTFALFSGEGQRNPIAATKFLLSDVLPLYLGLGDGESGWINLRSIILGIIYSVLLFFLLKGLLKKRIKYIYPVIVLLVVTVFAYITSRWGGLLAFRYFFPAYSALPIMVSCSLIMLKEKSKLFFYIFIFLILISNTYKNVEFYVDERKNDPASQTSGVITFLKSKGISHAYSDYWLAPRLTFESKEEIICAQPYALERYPKYRDILNNSNNFAYVLSQSTWDIKAFDDNLRAIGVVFKREDIKGYAVFYSFSYPEIETIPRKSWKALSYNGDNNTDQAFDGDIETAWFSGEPKKDGMWFKIDLGSIQKVSGLSILPGLVMEGIMNGYSVEVSQDGNNWVLVRRMDKDLIPWLDWSNGGPRFSLYHPKVKVTFEPVMARFIRITHHGKDEYYNWTIAEVFAYKPAEKEIYPYENLINEGERLEVKGDYRGALKKYLDVIEADKDYEEGYYRIMSLMQDLNIPPGPANEKAEVFEKHGLIEKAIENYEFEYKRLYQSGSYGSGIFKHLAALYEKAGNTDKAVYFRKRIDEEFSPSVKKGMDFGGMIEFLGYDIKEGRSPEVVYYWKAIGKIKKDLNAFVHFIGPDGKVAFQNDHLLFSDDRPISKWVKNEVYKERFKIQVPENLKQGTYTIRIGLWDPKTEKRLKVKTGLLKKKDEVTIGELRIIE